MPFVGFEQVAATGTRKTVAQLTVPVNANHAELQATGGNVRYWMAGDPVAGGMVLVSNTDPKSFPIEDVRNITFTSDGVDCLLLLHYAT
ncbi:hypothetical protein LCGC14_0249310 [marine sediment metagenome]|uniref:Uncharacterized protein n=1 Tax=marine sediment metagenome TaxID=412755 RepID=A0A0F9X9T3_9ZZZZ